MNERTNEELAGVVDAMVKRSTVIPAEIPFFNEVARRLREMPEGERIEGCEYG